MNRTKKSLKITAAALCVSVLCMLVLYGCSRDSGYENDKKTDTVTLEDVVYDSDDIYSSWKDQNPNTIEMTGASARITGQGAKLNGKTIIISSPGVYAISGKLDDGQILVDAGNEGTVRLVMNGAEILCSDSSPIYVKNAGKTVISLEGGTENAVTDSKNYGLADTEADEPNAAIFSKADLTINGTGSLTVDANYNNGITGKDELKITGGNITVNSVDDGVLGRDMVAVREGNITIESEGDAIKSTNDTDTSKGFIVIEGGTFHLTSGTDGIQAETSVIITDGDFNISTGGGSANSSNQTGKDMKNPWGRWEENTAEEDGTDEAEPQSAKAVKSSADIVINGGNFKIDSSDDAIHSNNSIRIEGGKFSIASGDDGIHADSMLEITGGEVSITRSYEGIESASVYVAGGNVALTADDDGFNAAGGNDGSSVNGRPGQNSFSGSGDYKISIGGGYIAIDAAGDGIDSNGSVYMTGGTVIVNGPTNSGNGALDYGGELEVSGGTLIAAGSSGMAQAPGEGSAQYSVIMNYGEVQKAGTLFSVKDSDGSQVITFAPEKEYQSVVVSSPKLKKGGTYTLYSGGVCDGNGTDGLYTGGEYKDGTKIMDFTVSDTVTRLGESGAAEGGFKPGGGPGGGMWGDKPDSLPGEIPDGARGEMPGGFQGETPDGSAGATPEDMPDRNSESR